MSDTVSQSVTNDNSRIETKPEEDVASKQERNIIEKQLRGGEEEEEGGRIDRNKSNTLKCLNSVTVFSTKKKQKNNRI